jgi:photosystem II stability/assembly factor-like uncharacterized protein
MRPGLHTPQSSTAGRNARRLGLVASLALLCAQVSAADSAPPQAEKAPLAAKAMLLDVASAGNRLVAVGDRGHVLVSADRGANWEQVLVPTRAMLNAVAFADAQHGTAVGHDGVILSTADGGRTWRRSDQGADLDTIYLDVLFLDSKRGYIAGAYGKFLATEDGGQTWAPRKASEDDLHFNRINAGPDQRLYLSGESGTVLASADFGATWSRLEVPYDGSIYGVLALSATDLLAYGLRGHVFRSSDAGASWEPVETGSTVLLMGATRAADGTIAIGGLGGNIFLSRDEGRTLRRWHPPELGTGVSDLLALDARRIVVCGEGGVIVLELPD